MTARQIAKHYGSVSAAARAAGVARQTLHTWHRTGVPAAWQAWYELATGGALKAQREGK